MRDEPLSVRHINARHEWTPIRSLGIEMHSRAWGTRVDGSGTSPIVLVPGVGQSSRYWVPLGEQLGLRYDVLAPDLPGFGKSPSPRDSVWPAGPTVPEQAEQLREWLDARGVSKFVLCGHSSGAQVGLEFAMRYPERVERLILLAPTGDPALGSMWRHLPRLGLASFFEPPALIAVAIAEYLTAGTARTLQQAKHAAGEATEAKLPHVRMPTLAVGGELDPLVPRTWTKRITSTLPHAELVEIGRAGHAIHFTSPREIADLIAQFFEPTGPVATTSRAVPTRISPRLHALIDGVVSAAALTLPRAWGWSAETRRVCATAAVASVISNVATDHRPRPERGASMATHATLDAAAGLTLLGAAAIGLRNAPRGERLAVAGLGLFHLAAAMLTNKPAGHVRRISVPATNKATSIENRSNGQAAATHA